MQREYIYYLSFFPAIFVILEPNGKKQKKKKRENMQMFDIMSADTLLVGQKYTEEVRLTLIDLILPSVSVITTLCVKYTFRE